MKTGPKKIWIVNQYISFTGGCCPDLPDSTWTTEEEARRRVKQLYEDALQGYIDHGFDKDDVDVDIADDWSEVTMSLPTPHDYCHFYISGCVPLCSTLEEFNNLPNPLSSQEQLESEGYQIKISLENGELDSNPGEYIKKIGKLEDATEIAKILRDTLDRLVTNEKNNSRGYNLNI